MTDLELQRHVQQELAWDSHVDAAAIGVAVHHGVVTLTGVVESWADKHAAEQAVRRVAGVIDLANEIEIKPSWVVERTDAEIAEAARNALAWGVFVPHRKIRCTVTDRGHVTLTGTVATLRERDDAEAALETLAGIRLVTNEIEVRPPVVAPRVLRSSIEHALERHVAREADRITIDVEGDTVVLTGTVGSWAERRAVLGTARGTPGVRRVDDRLRIEA